MAASSTKTVVYAATTGNALVALTKFLAAWWTGSSAMLSEAIHSLVDTGNQLLLLYGMQRAARPPDELHPLGYGRELYFWSFVVALLMFTIGAGVALYEGVQHLIAPLQIADPLVSYVVLGCAAVFEGTSWMIALREFRKAKGDLQYYEAVLRSKDPPAFIVLFEDSAALLGLAIAFAGTFAAEQLALPWLDGAASVGIGLLLGITALVLARESKELLIGEPARPALRRSIMELVRKVPAIERAQIVLTVHLAPEQVVVALNLEFRDDLTTPEIEQATRELERLIHQAHPEVIAIFVKPEAMVQPPLRATGSWRRIGRPRE
ncbi:MAG TPA: cation diffusion facilitator family transporter [Pseudolabrys sp.]|nr:cation diffusion facilitator family transporter [Pseudolabrys sp.]